MTARSPHRSIRPALAAGALTLLGAVLLALAACTVDLLPGAGQAPELYVLTPKSTFSPDLPTVDAQLVIETPIASEGLNTHRMALRQSPLTLDYFASSRWTERAPKLVQTMLVESFENTGRIVSVGRQGVDLRADYALRSDLREFQAEYLETGAPPTVWVRLNAKLVKMPERMIVASETFEQRTKAEGRGMTQVVSAFDESLNKVLKRAVEWTLRTIDATESRT